MRAFFYYTGVSLGVSFYLTKCLDTVLGDIFSARAMNLVRSPTGLEPAQLID